MTTIITFKVGAYLLMGELYKKEIKKQIIGKSKKEIKINVWFDDEEAINEARIMTKSEACKFINVLCDGLIETMREKDEEVLKNYQVTYILNETKKETLFREKVGFI
jgi:hypothetical protein